MQPARRARSAVAVDIDPLFQQVLAAWLGARAYQVDFVPLGAALEAGRGADLVVCELAAPKLGGGHTLHRLAQRYPGAPVIALSSRFVAGASRAALARQLGAQAALPKPCSRYDFDTALDAAVAMPPHPATDPDEPHAADPSRPAR